MVKRLEVDKYANTNPNFTNPAHPTEFNCNVMTMLNC